MRSAKKDDVQSSQNDDLKMPKVRKSKAERVLKSFLKSFVKKPYEESITPKKYAEELIEIESSENTIQIRDEYFNGCISPEQGDTLGIFIPRS